MKDRARAWVNVMPAFLAGICSMFGHSVEGGKHTAAGTHKLRATEATKQDRFQAIGFIIVLGCDQMEDRQLLELVVRRR